MDFKGGITLIFLWGMIIFTIKECYTCDISSHVGASIKIELKDISLDKADEIKWKHNSRVIVKIQGEKQTIDKKFYISNASLFIKNVSMENNGSYEVEVYSEKGILKKTQSKILCVNEMLHKPKLTLRCEERPVAECEAPSKGQTLIWYKNNEEIQERKLTIGINKKDKIKCVWKNDGQTAESNEHFCSEVNNSTEENKLFGFERWIMVGILSGGGGLVLLLMIVLVTCACQSCKRREKHLRDEEELRLNNLHTPPQRSKHTARGQPAPPVPQEDPEVSNYEVDDLPPKVQSRTKNQQRIRPPPPPLDDDEQPPPLPQPRKKVPHAKKNKGPLYMQP